MSVLVGLGSLIVADHRAEAAWEALFLTMLVVLIPVLVAVFGERVEPFEPIYLVSVAYFLYFVYAPAMDVLQGNVQYFGKDVSELLPRGSLYASMGILSMMLGYYCYRPFSRLLVEHFPVPKSAGAGPRRYGWLLLAVAVICFGAYVSASRLSWMQLLTLGQLGSSAEASSAGEAATSPFRNYLANTIECFIPAFMILYVFGRVKRRWLVMMFVAILVVYTTIGFRYRILVFVLAPVVFHYLKRGRRPTAAALGLAALVCVLMVGGIGMLRTSFRSGTEIETEDLTIGRAQETFVSSLSIYQPFLGVVDAIPAEHQFFGWRPFTYVFLQPIPRALWPEKPEAPVREIVTAAFDGRAEGAGLAYPNMGEFYASFGVVGVIVGMLCFGIVMRTLYQYLLRHPDNDWIRIFYAISLPFLVQVVSRGYFVQIVQEAAFLLGPVVLGMWLSHRGSWGMGGHAPVRNNASAEVGGRLARVMPFR